MESTGCAVGIDLGIKDLVITSDGDKFDNLKLIKKYEDKLAKEQKLECDRNCKKCESWEFNRCAYISICQ